MNFDVLTSDKLVFDTKDDKLMISKDGNWLKLTNGKDASITNMKKLGVSGNDETLEVTIPSGVRHFVSGNKIIFTDKPDNNGVVEY